MYCAGYGLSETTAGALMLDRGEVKPGSIGSLVNNSMSKVTRVLQWRAAKSMIFLNMKTHLIASFVTMIY